MEIFGGSAGVSKFAIKMRWPTGKNFDLVTGENLTEPRNRERLLAYINKYKPLVVVAGPPCTAFANLAKINVLKYPETYNESRKVGLALARLMAEVCMTQLQNGRYFLIENPQGSELFQLEFFQRLLENQTSWIHRFSSVCHWTTESRRQSTNPQVDDNVVKLERDPSTV